MKQFIESLNSNIHQQSITILPAERLEHYEQSVFRRNRPFGFIFPSSRPSVRLLATSFAIEIAQAEAGSSLPCWDKRCLCTAADFNQFIYSSQRMAQPWLSKTAECSARATKEREKLSSICWWSFVSLRFRNCMTIEKGRHTEELYGRTEQPSGTDFVMLNEATNWCWIYQSPLTGGLLGWAKNYSPFSSHSS